MPTTSDKPGRWRSLHWAWKTLVCMALVPVIVLGPMVVIMYWPGLEFSFGSRSLGGWGVARSHLFPGLSPSFGESMEVQFGIGSIIWDRYAFPESTINTSNKGFIWFGQQQDVWVIWKTPP